MCLFLEYGVNNVQIVAEQKQGNGQSNVKNSVSSDGKCRKLKYSHQRHLNVNNADRQDSKSFISQKLDRLKELEKEESKLKQKTQEFKKQLKKSTASLTSTQSNKSSQAKSALLKLKKSKNNNKKYIIFNIN